MSTETVAERFWAESHRKAERRKEIAAMPVGLERMNMILADAWNPKLVKALIEDDDPLFDWGTDRNVGNRFDQWLAEDGYIPEVRRALGLG